MRPHVLLALAFVLLMSLAAGLTSLAAGGATDPRHDVQVPVIFEGVRFEPAQFNALLARTPQDLHFAVVAGQEDRMYAFRSLEQVRAFLGRRVSGKLSPGLAAPARQPLANHNCSDTMDPYWSEYFEHTNCGGAVYSVGPGTMIASLGTWNDKISSISCSYQSSVEYCHMFEHETYSGASFTVAWGTVWADLGLYGWSDRASSLWVETF